MQEYTSDPLVGTLVDSRYLIQSRLARGGMSTVYVATDQRLERDVALKVLHPHLAGDPQFLDRLGREAKAAARLSHPHVVGVLDQGEDGRIAYLVMEYVKGHTLRDVLQGQEARSRRAWRWPSSIPWSKDLAPPTRPASSTATSSPKTS